MVPVHLRAVQDTHPAPCTITETAGEELSLSLVANRAASAGRLNSKIFIKVRVQQLMFFETTAESDT